MVLSIFPKVADRSPLILSAVFVLLWSTGFIFAKLGLEYAQPFTFLALRFCIVTVLIGIIAIASRAPWPRTLREVVHFSVIGLLMHGLYLGGTYASIGGGVPAGIAALIVGLQPLLTATVVGPALGERVRLPQWIGLCLGFVEVALVLWEKLVIDKVPGRATAWSVIALFAITAATLYQKRFCPTMDWRTGGFFQYAAATLLIGLFAVLGESGAVRWDAGLILSLAWLVVVLSIGAITLLNWLIRRGRAARIASLFYLVPPMVALESWLWFGEKLGTAALIGMAITAVGVALVNRS